jgi:hypothetical protein
MKRIKKPTGSGAFSGCEETNLVLLFVILLPDIRVILMDASVLSFGLSVMYTNMELVSIGKKSMQNFCKGTSWKTGRPTAREKMTIFFILGA